MTGNVSLPASSREAKVAWVVNSFLLLVGAGEGYASGEAVDFGDGAKGYHAGT